MVVFGINYSVDQVDECTQVIWMVLLKDEEVIARAKIEDPDNYAALGRQVANWFKEGLFPREAFESILTQASDELQRLNCLSTPDPEMATARIFGPGTPDEPLWTEGADSGAGWPQ